MSLLLRPFLISKALRPLEAVLQIHWCYHPQTSFYPIFQILITRLTTILLSVPPPATIHGSVGVHLTTKPLLLSFLLSSPTLSFPLTHHCSSPQGFMPTLIIIKGSIFKITNVYIPFLSHNFLSFQLACLGSPLHSN